ncbi:MAG: hypothetical protein Q9218_001980 [Villophora microphyllina]
MAATSIYAELLVNIRRLTVVASLPSDSDSTTSVKLSPDGTVLTVLHEGQVTTVELPASVRDGFVPQMPPRIVGELSLRLPIKEPVDRIYPSDPLIVRKPIMSASSLSADTQVACRTCHALLAKESVKVWKDLPSDNWAEMMDFWHCHKPDTHEGRDQYQHGLHKGYGAANNIEPTVGVGLIDIMSVLLLSQDCNIALDDRSKTKEMIDAVADTIARYQQPQVLLACVPISSKM